MKKTKQFKPKRSKGTRRYDGRAKIKKMYDSKWADYSKRFLAINRKCYNCGNSSEVVDHLRAHKGSEVLFKKLDNHIPLCHSCHNRITSLFDKHAVPKFEEKLKFMANNRMAKNLTFKVRVMPFYNKEWRRREDYDSETEGP